MAYFIIALYTVDHVDAWEKRTATVINVKNE